MSGTVVTLRSSIKRLLSEKDMSSSDLARALELNPSNIVPFTNPDRHWNPSLETLEKLAVALGVRVGDLFGPPGAVSRQDLSQLKAEIRNLQQAVEPFANLPADIQDGLAHVRKPGHFDVLRAVLEGFGVLGKGPAPGSRSSAG